MNLRRAFGIALVGLCLTASSAFAADDIVLSVNLAPSLITTSGSTGQTTYQAQEGAHEAVTDSTGQEIEHFYIWLYVNGQPVAAIDPVWVSGRQPDGN